VPSSNWRKPVHLQMIYIYIYISIFAPNTDESLLFSTNIWLYFRKCGRRGHTYCESL